MSKKRKKAWKVDAAPTVERSTTEEVPPHTLRGKALREYIEAKAHELYLEEDGEVLDNCIRNGQLVLEAFESQMLAIRDGGESWGPTITPYEARMNRSLQERLLRLKRTQMRELRRRVEDDLMEDAEYTEQTHKPAPQTPAPTRPTTPPASTDAGAPARATGNHQAPVPPGNQPRRSGHTAVLTKRECAETST